MAYSSKPPGFMAKQTFIGICIVALLTVIIAAIDELGIGAEIVRSVRIMFY